MTYHFFISFFLFLIGIVGMYTSGKSIIHVLLCLEILFIGSNINFALSSISIDDIYGQLYVLFILAVAAAESALGLALLVVYYRMRGGISVELVALLKSFVNTTNFWVFILNYFFFKKIYKHK